MKKFIQCISVIILWSTLIVFLAVFSWSLITWAGARPLSTVKYATPAVEQIAGDLNLNSTKVTVAIKNVGGWYDQRLVDEIVVMDNTAKLHVQNTNAVVSYDLDSLNTKVSSDNDSNIYVSYTADVPEIFIQRQIIAYLQAERNRYKSWVDVEYHSGDTCAIAYYANYEFNIPLSTTSITCDVLPNDMKIGLYEQLATIDQSGTWPAIALDTLQANDSIYLLSSTHSTLTVIYDVETQEYKVSKPPYIYYEEGVPTTTILKALRYIANSDTQSDWYQLRTIEGNYWLNDYDGYVGILLSEMEELYE